jgi:hypothetical protein
MLVPPVPRISSRHISKLLKPQFSLMPWLLG